MCDSNGIGSLLPEGATYADSATLHPAVALDAADRLLGAVSEKRRAEFSMGRQCARTALSLLGEPGIEVGVRASGEPEWPAGVVGSITHTTGYVAAAVARTSRIRAIGIDAEPVRELEAGVGSLVLTPEEYRWVEGDAERLVRVFSAKESVFKAWYPIRGAWLDFRDVAISFGMNGRFVAKLVSMSNTDAANDDAALIDSMLGNWCRGANMVYTSVHIPR